MSEVRELDPDVAELCKILREDARFGKFSIEDFIHAIQEFVEQDLHNYVINAPESEPPHPLVIACLEGCVNHLSDASMAYYASLK